MSKIENEIEQFLLNNNITAPSNKIIIGYSGGEDSTCLLFALKNISTKYGFQIIAAHLNHNWRGAESLNEQKNCEKIAKLLDIEFYTKTLPCHLKCSEEIAREERYKFFNECAQYYGAKILFTAHTKTDNAETLLYRIIKGTGIEGLKGIPIKRKSNNLTIFRPLLNISRNEIENFNKTNNLLTNNDSSNTNVKYARNKIRHKICPLAKEINNNMENSLQSLAEIANQESEIIEEYLKLIKHNVITEAGGFNSHFYELSSAVAKKLIYQTLKEKKVDYDKNTITEIYDFIIKNKNSKNGKLMSITSNLWIFVSANNILLTNKIFNQSDDFKIHINEEGRYIFKNQILTIESITSFDGKISPAYSSEIFVDLSKISFPLTMRKRDKNAEKSDFIQPFGMTGTMKLKKYFINKGINRLIRDEILVLYKDNEALWIPGYGISEKLRIINNPTHRIVLKKIGE